MEEKKTSSFPLKPDGEIDVEKVKEIFMASSHVLWSKFAEEHNHKYNEYRHFFPVLTWQDEKRIKIAEKNAEELANMLFDRRFEWHKDVLNTLKWYPKVGDAILQQINRKLQHIQKMSDEEFNYGSPPVKEKGKVVRPGSKRVSFMDLQLLGNAYKTVTEAKHKSLLLSTWEVRKAEDETKTEEKEVTENPGGIFFEMIGKGPMNLKDIQQALDTYLDKPNEEPTDGDG